MPSTGLRSKLRTALAAALALSAVAAVVAVVLAGWEASGSDYALTSEEFPDNRVLAVMESFDTDGDGRLSREEAAAVTEVSVEGTEDLAFLALLPNVTTLAVSGTNIEFLDLSGANNLERLTLDCPALTEVTWGKTGQLAYVDVSGTKLAELDAAVLQAAAYLDVTGCENLAALNLSANSALETLRATGTALTEVDVSGAAGLSAIEVDDDVAVVGLEATPIHEQWVPVHVTKVVSSSGGTSTYEYSLSLDEAGVATGYAESTVGVGDTSEQAVYEFNYDESGNVIGIWDVEAESMDVEFVYDDAGNVIRRTGVPTEYSYTYDDQRRLESFVSTGTVLTFAYDEAGRLASYTSSFGGRAVEYTYAYDAEGRVTGVSDSSDRPMEYTVDYDDNGACSSILIEGAVGSETYRFVRDEDGRLTNMTMETTGDFKQLGNVDGVQFEYNAAGQISGFTYEKWNTEYTFAVEYERFFLGQGECVQATLGSFANPLWWTSEGLTWMNPERCVRTEGVISASMAR
ncbi:hypothetical protein [Slackia heliotrinireducens]|uniref:hypothetical protein n=1 Tax=Slackia heliotrinireducens TaxID=84110 RepID=UPI003315EC6F